MKGFISQKTEPYRFQLQTKRGKELVASECQGEEAIFLETKSDRCLSPRAIADFSK
jgi:hypothetical protein